MTNTTAPQEKKSSVFSKLNESMTYLYGGGVIGSLTVGLLAYALTVGVALCFTAMAGVFTMLGVAALGATFITKVVSSAEKGQDFSPRHVSQKTADMCKKSSPFVKSATVGLLCLGNFFAWDSVSDILKQQGAEREAQEAKAAAADAALPRSDVTISCRVTQDELKALQAAFNSARTDQERANALAVVARRCGLQQKAL